MPDVDLTKPEVQMRLIVAELVWTVAQLEALKAALTRDLAAAVLRNETPDA